MKINELCKKKITGENKNTCPVCEKKSVFGNHMILILTNENHVIIQMCSLCDVSVKDRRHVLICVSLCVYLCFLQNPRQPSFRHDIHINFTHVV